MPLNKKLRCDGKCTKNRMISQVTEANEIPLTSDDRAGLFYVIFLSWKDNFGRSLLISFLTDMRGETP